MIMTTCIHERGVIVRRSRFNIGPMIQQKLCSVTIPCVTSVVKSYPANPILGIHIGSVIVEVLLHISDSAIASSISEILLLVLCRHDCSFGYSLLMRETNGSRRSRRRNMTSKVITRIKLPLVPLSLAREREPLDFLHVYSHVDCSLFRILDSGE